MLALSTVQCLEDTAKAFEELKAKKSEGIMVDLRNDPGGSLEEVARMLGQVIKSGPVVQIRDGNGNVNVFEDTDGGEQIYAGPMAVLVNLASASASEIYSAAIQDYERGIIIGSTTTGKGTAQVQLDSLAHGQATLTQRKFYRVTGGSTQNKGVIPDINWWISAMRSLVSVRLKCIEVGTPFQQRHSNVKVQYSLIWLN